MTKRLPFLIATLCLSVAATAESAPPERIEIPIVHPGCPTTKADGDTIVVCGNRDEPYRIDSTTLSTLRQLEARDDPTQQPRPHAITGSCEEVGPASCGGQILPLLPMAVKTVEIVARALEGESILPALRTRPSEYEIYRQAQEKEARKK